jgi:hypothetical protein
MATPMITFTVHEDGGQENNSERIRNNYELNRGDKTLFLAHSNGTLVRKAYFVSSDISHSLISIDLIKFNRPDPANPDLILSVDYQNEIMTAFVGFLLGTYPLKTFSMSGSLFGDQRHLRILMKTDMFKQRFEGRACYIRGLMDFTLLPRLVVSIPLPVVSIPLPVVSIPPLPVEGTV